MGWLTVRIAIVQPTGGLWNAMESSSLSHQGGLCSCLGAATATGHIEIYQRSIFCC
jgi:hypothetical protein